MKAEIRYSTEDLPNLITSREVKTVNQLDAFLMEHNLIREFSDLREDIKWDSVSYFIRRSEL